MQHLLSRWVAANPWEPVEPQMGKLYDQVRSVGTLRSAWHVIYQNGIRSKSSQTRREISEFAEDAETHLSRISRQLRTNKFKFAPSHGIPVQKKGKSSKRPLVLSPIPNRIVQRAILEVIQNLDEIKTMQRSWLNFGGVPELGVPQAVTTAYKAMLQKPFFIRTDIESFFVNIPRNTALQKITDLTKGDDAFNSLLKFATDVELDNIAQLESDASLFPLEDIGVAQGSCLSPLLCNLLLDDFDKQMNGRGIECVRYIDDFILFAPDQSKGLKAFNSAKKYLGSINLNVYDPQINREKAEMGVSREGFDFLGCTLTETNIRPSEKAHKRIQSKVKELLAEALIAATNPAKANLSHKTYSETLTSVNNVLQGWANTYVFCTDMRLIKNLDTTIDGLLKEFDSKFELILAKLSSEDRRRLLGVYLLQDCKPKNKVLLHDLVEAERSRLLLLGKIK